MRNFPSILAICLMAGACAAPATGGGTASPARSSAPRYAVESGPDKLILQLSEEGGFVAPGYQLTRLPQLALYGDGRVIVAGQLDSIYPRPLLPNLRQLHVTPAEIQTILAAADAAGLLGPDANYGAAGVADASDSVFRTTVAGVTHVVSAYALGMTDLGQTADGAAARSKLQSFEEEMLALSAFLGRPVSEAEAYQPKAMRIFAAPTPTPNSASPTPQVVAWPLAADPASAGETTSLTGVRCVVVSGAELTTFLAVAGTANTLTVWTAPSGRYSVSVRPLYPEESRCSTVV